MAREAHREGSLPSPLFKRIEQLAERIEDYLSEPRFPSLLHGDLWTGNVLVREGRIAGFVDHAISCGHPEIELAFTTMFGTFGEAFFEAYENLMPLEPGFHEIRSSLTISTRALCMSGCSERVISRQSNARSRASVSDACWAKKNRPGHRRAGLPCETSRAPKAWPLQRASARPPILFLSFRSL
jgi:hypothetical protein